MKKICDCTKGLKGIKNITLLYFIVFLSSINMIWFFYYHFHSVIIFFTCCLAIYLVTKNMIYVLGISLFITDLSYLVNKNYEGFEDNQQENIKNIENIENEYQIDTQRIDASYNKINDIKSTKIDLSNNDYMQDKNIINKLKQIDPNILNILENMNSMNIKELNETINKTTNKQLDP